MIAVVTGTSSGIGLATSLELARAGYRVLAGMRNPAKAGPLRETAAKEELPVEVIELDEGTHDVHTLILGEHITGIRAR